MSKPSSFSLRGRKALVVIKDDRDLSIVKRQLERLGIDIVTWERDSTPECRADVVLIDDELATSMGREAVRFVAERFSLADCNLALERYYTRLAHRRAR